MTDFGKELFKKVLPPNKMVDLYNNDIKRLASMYDMNANVIGNIAEQSNKNYFYRIRNTGDKNADDGVYSYLDNFEKSVDGDLEDALPLTYVGNLIRKIRGIRKDSRGDIYKVTKNGGLSATFNNQLENRKIANQVAFSNSLSRNFPKASGEINVKPREANSDFGREVYLENGKKVSAPYNWKWTVEDEGIDVVQSGKRKLFTLKAEITNKVDAKGEPFGIWKTLAQEGIKAYRCILLDPVFFKGSRYGYTFNPVVHENWWVLKKETMDEDLIGVGKDIHSAHSLIDRRYNTRAKNVLVGV